MIPTDEAMSTDLLSSLTDAQREAVTHVDGPLLILAGPGSGKTRVVTHRIAYLMEQGVAPRNIVALTFTNKAADEMRMRLERLAPGKKVWLSTFHRFCARLLRQYAPLVGLAENFTIYDMSDSERTLKRVIQESGKELTHTSPDAVAHEISRAKNELIPPAAYAAHGSAGPITKELYPLYQQRLLASNAVDFDDLLMHIARLLREHPEVRAELDERFRYILVDEYQDTNLAQYAIVRALSIDHPNLAVTGDPDQAIYGWRGADLKNILEFEHDYPQVRVVRLERNYRSTQHIVRAAGQLIAHNKRRKKKDIYTENDRGSPVKLVVYPNHHEEADSIARRIVVEIQAGRRRPRDFAVFYRVNALSRSFENAFRDHGLPYQIVGGMSFFQRQEIKDVLAFLYLINNPRDDAALERIINVPARGIGDSTIKRLRAYAGERRLSLLDAARQAGLVPDLAKRSAVAVAKFVSMYDKLCLWAHSPLEELIGVVLQDTGYLKQLKDSEDPQDQERLANLEEMLTDAREFDLTHPEDGTLEQFLERTALATDLDEVDGTNDRVMLMTIHAAKGLEFPVVFVTAVEQGLIPHERARHNEDEIEEERRLLFVAMTRAEQELQLSLAAARDFRGQRRYVVPSQFLMELPREEMELQQLAAALPRGGEEVQESPDESWRQEETSGEWGVGSGESSGDESFDPSQLETPSPAASPLPKAPVTTPAAKIMTAADLLGPAATDSSPTPVDLFRHGMVVNHPEYGAGQIVALSGNGMKRQATVRFFNSGEKKFRLAQSPLRPVGEK